MTMVENQNVTLTDNGMITNPTSLNKCVDLFFSIGSENLKPSMDNCFFSMWFYTQ